MYFVEVVLVEHAPTILWPRLACWLAQCVQCALCALMHCVSFCNNSFIVITKFQQNYVYFSRPFKALRPSSMVIRKVCFFRSIAVDSVNAKFDV